MDVARQHHKAHTTNTEGTHLAEPHAKAPGRTEWPPNTGSFGVGGSRKEATGLEVGDGDNMYCPKASTLCVFGAPGWHVRRPAWQAGARAAGF